MHNHILINLQQVFRSERLAFVQASFGHWSKLKMMRL